MARIKDRPRAELEGWADVDEALRELGECENLITEIEVELNRQQAEAKQAAEAKAAPHQERIKEISEAIKRYVKAHRKELDGKTKKLNHGETGYRRSTRCVVPGGAEKTVIGMLKKLGMLDCVSVTESINREVLRGYPEDTVTKTGAYLKTTETFWLEASREKLQGAP